MRRRRDDRHIVVTHAAVDIAREENPRTEDGSKDESTPITIDKGLPVPNRRKQLGTDGCGEEALDPEEGWGLFSHFVSSQLRWAFGVDPETVGLSQDVQSGFPGARFGYRER